MFLRPIRFQHPPSEITFKFIPTKNDKFLTFSLALNPEVWSSAKGDGVLFEVFVLSNGRKDRLFSQWVDPKNNAKDQKWHDGSINLTRFFGKEITLILSTSPGENTTWDWAGWGSLTLSPTSQPKYLQSNQFQLVYDNEIKIYENKNSYPRAFIAHKAKMVKNEEESLQLMKKEDFNPRKEIVIEGQLSGIQIDDLKNSPIEDRSSVEILDYKANKVTLKAELENPGLLVLTDTYYPGWRVYVDGKEKTILLTDYFIRSVFLDKGNHKIVFLYDPWSFKLGFLITFVTFAGILNFGLIKKKLLIFSN